MKDTDYYINKKLSTNINNLFYNIRQLLKSKQITNTWVYNNNVYISTDKTNKIYFINDIQLENVTFYKDLGIIFENNLLYNKQY